VTERWDRDRVLAQAPDASSRRAALGLASARSWQGTGWLADRAVWGECQGSAAAPYRAVVDLSGGPASRCSCPSRKFPCKHALGLLLLWSDGAVPGATAAPDWAADWLQRRAGRPSGQPAPSPDTGTGTGTGQPAPGQPGTALAPADPEAARRRAAQREDRVAAGMAELDRWLCDQVRQGLAGAQRAGYRHWDSMAARLVDAQAAGVAGVVRGLAAVPASGTGWAGRLLAEYALLRLLTVAHHNLAGLPEPLRETVRSRIGFTVRQAEVESAATSRLPGQWDVVAQHDSDQDRIRTRRVWLRHRDTGQPALVLSFAPTGQSLDASLTVGTTVEAELAFYPAALPLRAVIVKKGPPSPAGPPPGQTVTAMLTGWASALAADPWLETWPATLADVAPARQPRAGWSLADPSGDAVPLHPDAGDCWPLVGLSGGHPVTVAGEWGPRGFWPLTAWTPRGEAVQL
jgi:SWIM zinc finger